MTSAAMFGESATINGRDFDQYAEPGGHCCAVCDALDQSDNIVMVVEERDSTFMIVSSNDEASRATGYTADQLRGRPFGMLVAPDVDDTAFQAVLAAARQERAHRGQLRCRTATGQLFWFGLHLMPASDAGAGRFVVLGHDITAKLRHREHEQAVQSLLAKVFVTVDAAVYIRDLHDRIVMTNPAFERLIGASPGKLVGTAAVELYAPACRDALAAVRTRQDAAGSDYTVDVILLHRTGREIPCHAAVAMVQRPDLHRFRIVTVRANVPEAPEAMPRTITAAGRIQLIGLDEVRESLGARWAVLKERAVATAETVLQRRLGPKDTFTKTDDAGFVVCFAGATEEEAGFRAAAIGREIRQRLIGEGKSPEIAHVFSASVPVPPGAETLPVMELAALVQNRVGERLRAIQETARHTLAAALSTSPYEVQEIRSRGNDEPIGWRVQFSQATRRALDIAAGALPAAETASLDQDVMLVSFAQECIAERALLSPGKLVFVTLSAEILLVRKRLEACLDACRRIGDELHKQLVLVVTAPADGASRRIENVLPRLRSFCRHVGVAVETFDLEGLDIRGAGISFLVVDGDATDAGPKVKACADRLHAQRCRLMVCGADPRRAAGLFASGADLLTLPGRTTPG